MWTIGNPEKCPVAPGGHLGDPEKCPVAPGGQIEKSIIVSKFVDLIVVIVINNCLVIVRKGSRKSHMVARGQEFCKLYRCNFMRINGPSSFEAKKYAERGPSNCEMSFRNYIAPL